jgi:hypothetical protein
MAKRKQQCLIKGTANHRRTESDYMSTLLDTVTLDDWQDIVSSTLTAAKQGDAQARAWLGQYLVGKPVGKAPTPLTVVVQQLNDDNPLISRLANKVIDQYKYPALHQDNALEDQIKAVIVTELAEKVPVIKTTSSSDSARLSTDLDAKQNG